MITERYPPPPLERQLLKFEEIQFNGKIIRPKKKMDKTNGREKKEAKRGKKRDTLEDKGKR